jgi:hypothetical protein
LDLLIGEIMSYNNTGIQVIQGTLNYTDIVGSNVTPAFILPPPGAGLVNIVISGLFNVKMGNTQYSNAGNTWLIYGNTGNDQVNLAGTLLTNQFNSFLANTNYIFGLVGAGIGSDWLGGTVANINAVQSNIAVNAPIYFTGSNAIADGSGTVDWTIAYMTLKCS